MRVARVCIILITIIIAAGLDNRITALAADVFISNEDTETTPQPSSGPWPEQQEPWQEVDAWEKFRTPQTSYPTPEQEGGDDDIDGNESSFRPEISPSYFEPLETAQPSQQPTFPAYIPELPETYDFEIKFVHSLKGFSKQLDSAVKKSSAKATNSSIEDWSLVEYRLVNDNDASNNSDRTSSSNSTLGTQQTWIAVYRAKLKQWPAKKYEKYVSSGKLGQDLSGTRLLQSSGGIQTSLLGRSIAEEDASDTIQTNSGGIEDTGEEGEEEQESIKKNNSKSGSGFGWQIGTGVGLLALVAASALGAYFFGVHRKSKDRKRRVEESFPDLSRTHSGTPSAMDEQRTTSMRPQPRGADVLRGTAGIRSWQENAAKKARPAPAAGSGSIGSVGSFERQVPPKAYLPRDASQGTTSSEFAPNTSNTSSTAYVGDTLTTLSDDDGNRKRYSSVVESDIRTSDASTAHRVGSTGSTLTGRIPEEELTFVNFKQEFGGNRPNSMR